MSTSVKQIGSEIETADKRCTSDIMRRTGPTAITRIRGLVVSKVGLLSQHFSEEQIGEFQEAFGLFDKDGDGYLTSADLGVVVRSVGGVITDTEIKEMATEFQSEKNGLIDFADFLVVMAKTLASKESPQELLNAFEVFDRDGKGFISAVELRHVMTNLGEKLSEEDVEEMIKEADLEGTGQVNYNEFVKMIMS